MAKFRPTIILSAAITLDGKIATYKGDSELSSKHDKVRIHRLRSKVDAILVGKNTVMRDDPLLTVRHVKGKNPIRIILDSRATIKSSSKIIKTSRNIPTIIAISKKATRKNILRLQKHPVEVIISGKNRVNIKELLRILKRKKINRILLEGGGTVNWDFVRRGFVDKAIVTLTPFLVGGKEAITLVEGKGFSKISKSPRLKLEKIIRHGNELVLYYSLEHNKKN